MATDYDPMTDHYVALGVGSTASHDEIKKAHRALIRELHPDCGGDAMPAAQVNIARDVLVDPITREEYDRARREWHQEHLLASAFTDAGRQIHRERTQTRAGASAAADTARRTQRDSAAHAGDPSRTASAQRGSAAHADDPNRTAAAGQGERSRSDGTDWQPYLAKALFAGTFFRDALAGRSVASSAVIGAASLLDYVIKNRIGDNPALRECLDMLSHAIWIEHVDVFKGIAEQRTGRRWDPVARRWVVPTRKKARDGSSKAARSEGSSPTAAARHGRNRDQARDRRRRSRDLGRRSRSG